MDLEDQGLYAKYIGICEMFTKILENICWKFLRLSHMDEFKNAMLMTSVSFIWCGGRATCSKSYKILF